MPWVFKIFCFWWERHLHFAEISMHFLSLCLVKGNPWSISQKDRESHLLSKYGPDIWWSSGKHCHLSARQLWAWCPYGHCGWCLHVLLCTCIGSLWVLYLPFHSPETLGDWWQCMWQWMCEVVYLVCVCLCCGRLARPALCQLGTPSAPLWPCTDKRYTVKLQLWHTSLSKCLLHAGLFFHFLMSNLVLGLPLKQLTL